MFWVPVAMICAIVWCVKAVVDRGTNTRSQVDVIQEYAAREKFIKDHEADIDLICDIKDWIMTHKQSDYVALIQGFMGDDDENWEWFTLKRFLNLILLAQKGKLTSLPERAPWIDYKPGRPRPYTLWEMTERFFLRLEDELRKNGVYVTAVASYGHGKYLPVREWVEKHGYAYCVDFTTDFTWKETALSNWIGNVEAP